MPSLRGICAIVALLIGLTACGSSAADPSTPFTPRPNADNIFLMALTKFGITVQADDIPKMISVGRYVCTYIGEGHPPADAARESANNNTGMTQYNALEVVAAAVESYCPQVPEQ